MVPLLSATFTGAAGTALSDYTPETGAWVLSPGDFSSLKLDGAGNLEWPSGAPRPAPVILNTNPGIGTDHIIEATLTLNPVAAAPGADAGVSLSVYLRSTPYGTGGWATNNYVKATFTFIAGGILRTTVEYRYNGTVFPVSGSTVNSSAYPNADRTFTLKATLDGQYLLLYVDGSQIVLRDLKTLNPILTTGEGDVRIEANLAGVATYHGAKLGSLVLTGTAGPEMFLDQFIGSGNMVAHVPEVGNWNPTGMVDNTLSGSGQLRWGPSTRGEANLLGPRRKIVLEAVVTPTAIPVPPTFDMWFEMYLVAYLAPSPNFDLMLRWDTAAPAGWKTVCTYWDGVSTYIIDHVTAAASITLGTPYTFRIEVGEDAVDPGVRFFLNGALLASSAAVPVGAINRLGFRAETHAGTGIGSGTVEYIKSVSKANPSGSLAPTLFDFLLANFDGTGNLVGYVPEIGTTFTAPPLVNSLIGNASTSGGLAAAIRNVSGEWQFDTDNPIEPELFGLQTGTAPPVSDYYIELTLNFLAGNYGFDVVLCGRGQPSIYDATSLRCLGAVFHMNSITTTHHTLDYWVEANADDNAVTFVDGAGFGTYDLGTNTSCVMRVEFEGQRMRLFIDGNLLVDTAWTCAGPDFDLPGRIQYQFDAGGTGTRFAPWSVNQMKAGTEFLEVIVPAMHYLTAKFDDWEAGTWLSSYVPEEGSLGGHSLLIDFDDGSRWYTGPVNAANTAAMQLDGAGKLVWNAAAGQTLPGFVAATDMGGISDPDYWVAAEVMLNPHAFALGDDFALAMFVRPNGAVAGGPPYVFNAVFVEFQFDSDGELNVSLMYQNEGAVGGAAGHTIAYPDAMRTFSLRVECEGDFVRVYVDNVEVLNEDVTALDPVFANHNGNVWFGIDFASANLPDDAIKVNYLMAGTLPFDGPAPEPVEPGPTVGFWTAKVNAIEDTVP